MSYRLDGMNPLAYMGVAPNTPPQMVVLKIRPTVNDYNFNIGTFWVVPEADSPAASNEVYVLMSKSQNVATWVQLYPGSGGGGTNTFITDSGDANQAGGDINILGGSNIGTTGAGSTVTINLDDNVTITGEMNIGTELSVDGNSDLTGDLTVNGDVDFTTIGSGVVFADGAGELSANNGTDGQVIIGGGASPIWANLTSTGGSITITNGPNSINLEANGGGGNGSLVFIEERTADGDATLEFTNGISSSFNNYFVVIQGINPSVAEKTFICQFSIDGGSTWITTDYSNETVFTAGIEIIRPLGGGEPALTSYSSATTNIFNVTSGLGYIQSCTGVASSTIYDTVSGVSGGTGADSAYDIADTEVNAIRFLYDDSSVYSGVIALYGYNTTPTPPVASSGLIFLAEQTATADASLEFTAEITSTYKDYLILIKSIKPTVALTDFLVQLSTDGGGTWITTGYKNNNTTESGIVISAGNGATHPTTDSLTEASCNLMNVTTGSGIVGNITSNASCYDPNAVTVNSGPNSGFYVTPNVAVNALRFQFNDGAVFDGTVKIYGYVD